MAEPMDKAIHQSLQDITEMCDENEINKVLDKFKPLPEDKEYIDKLLHNKADQQH